MALKVYRVGDLDKYQRKADSMYQMFGRSTGYFGTGYYFCTKPEYCCTMTRENDPLYKLTLKDGIKLLTGTQKLHDKLKAFNSFMINYPRLLSKDLIDKEKRFAHYAIDYYTEHQLIGSKLKEDFEVWGDWADNWKEYLSREYGIREMISRAKDIPELEEFANILESDEPNFERIDEIQKENEDLFDYEYLSSMRDLVFDVLELLPIQLNTDTETIKMAADHIYETYESFYENGRLKHDSDLSEDDSFPTQLLKILGYEGVWPSDECDNTTYGGVIFDLENFTYERIADHAKDYIKKDLKESTETLKQFNVLYHGSKNGELRKDEKHSYNCLYVTPVFAYAAMYSTDSGSTHGCVFEMKPVRELNIFDANDEGALDKLKAKVEELNPENTLVRRIKWEDLKTKDWSSVCFKQDEVRDKLLLESVKALGYDGYINTEWDEDCAEWYARGLGGCGKVVNTTSIGIFNEDLLEIVDEKYFEDYSDDELFNECHQADEDLFITFLQDEGFDDYYYDSEEDAKKWAANNLLFLDVDEVNDLVDKYASYSDRDDDWDDEEDEDEDEGEED